MMACSPQISERARVIYNSAMPARMSVEGVGRDAVSASRVCDACNMQSAGSAAKGVAGKASRQPPICAVEESVNNCREMRDEKQRPGRERNRESASRGDTKVRAQRQCYLQPGRLGA